MTRSPRLPARPVAAAGVVALRGDAVLLVRRGKAPALGQWSLPGGAVEPGETARAAARREAQEETGVELRVLDVVDIYDGIYPGAPDRQGFHYLVADFLAVPLDDTEPQAGSDVLEARWVPLERIEAYDVTDAVRQVLHKALRLQQAGAPPGAAPRPRVEGLCVITGTDPARGRDHPEVARAAVAGGARVVQLRDKDRETGDLIATTRRVLALTRPAGVPLIVNDRVDVVLAAGADGVHLGVTDMSVADARRLLGPGPLIGYSPETPEQARVAADAGADYLGVGALYGSATKPDAGAPVGPERIGRIREAVNLPVIGIGGITAERVAAVMAAGAAGVAVVSAVAGAPDMVAAVRTLARALEDARPPRPIGRRRPP